MALRALQGLGTFSTWFPCHNERNLANTHLGVIPKPVCQNSGAGTLKEDRNRVNANRRSPVPRPFAWLLTLVAATPMLMGAMHANAQAQQVLRVIVADFQNVTRNGGENLAVQATAAVSVELTNTGSSRFYVFGGPEVLQEAKRLGLKVPSNPGQSAHFSRNDLLRISKELQADAIVEGDVGSTEAKKGRPVTVSLSVKVLDLSSLEYINGGFAQATAVAKAGETAGWDELVSRAVEDTALSSVRQIVQRQLVSATVLQRVGDTIILNRGLRDGLREGMELTISRDLGNGQRVKQGTVKIARSYATDSEAEVRSELGGIRPEDIAKALYVPPIKISILGFPKDERQANKSVNFSTIGTTLSALAMGVLIAAAGRTGQGTVTNLVAEASSESDLPVVRLTWNDTIFGNGNVLQYKIFRDPDFPYSPSLNVGGGAGGGQGGGGGAGGGAGGGQGGNTTVLPPIPIGVSSFRTFLDRPSPNFPYRIGQNFLAGVPGSGSLSGLFGGGGGQGGGGQGGGGGGQGGGGGGTGGGSGCTVVNVGGAIDTGFFSGTSYRYLVTSVIVRQITQSSGSAVGGGGGQGGGGGGQGGGGGGQGGGGGGFGGGGGQGGGAGGGQGGGQGGGGSLLQCIETDPLQTTLATPITPSKLFTPADTSRADISQFNPTWASRIGADIFQVEISLDRKFSNPSQIIRRQILSSAPTVDGQNQTLPDPLNLTTAPELLAAPAFAAFVADPVNNPAPTIFWRVGAKHDEDYPGPVNWLTKSATDNDTNWRFVYGRPFRFTPSQLPPPPPGGRSIAALNRAAARSRAEGLALPLPGDTAPGVRGATKTQIPSIQDILTGRGRKRF